MSTGKLVMDLMKNPNRKKKREPQEIRPTEEELAAYLEGLVQELNFRLFCETDYCTGKEQQQVLWVESITLTSYEEPKRKRSRIRRWLAEFFRRLGEKRKKM